MSSFQNNLENLKNKLSVLPTTEQLNKIEKNLSKTHSLEQIDHYIRAEINIKIAKAEEHIENIENILCKIASHQETLINSLLIALLNNQTLTPTEVTEYFIQAAIIADNIDTQPFLDTYIKGAVAEITNQKTDPFIQAQYQLLQAAINAPQPPVNKLKVIAQSVQVLNTANAIVTDSPSKKDKVVSHLETTATLVSNPTEENTVAYKASVNKLHSPTFKQLVGTTMKLIGAAGIVLSGIIALAAVTSTPLTLGIGTGVGLATSGGLSFASTALIQRGMSLFSNSTKREDEVAQTSVQKLGA